MSRIERWNTKSEIKRRLLETIDPENGAGPVLYVENGRKYSDDSEAHIAVFGRTGTGKSQCGSLPFGRECIRKGESLIAVDPKGELYYHLACYIPEGYQKFVVDLRHPRRSLTEWNPLRHIRYLYDSEDPEDNDAADEKIKDIFGRVFPWDRCSDKFWVNAAAEYLTGLLYGLFRTTSPEDSNLDNLAVMMQQSEEKFGPSTVLKTFYDMLPSDSLAKRNLATYVTAPNETRGSIHSVAADGMTVFSSSRGLMEMLSEDTMDIQNLDVHRPFVLFIIKPDETDVYDSLAGLIVTQMTEQLIRVAEDLEEKLPIRVNMILEELGSVGKSIPELPNLMSAGRSRNIRLMLILQSYAQLVDVYGKQQADIIYSNIGITIGFSTNNWETLKKWEQCCGEKRVERNGFITKEPLITAPQLAAMPVGTALVMVNNQYKFVTHLPLYDEMYDNSDWKAPEKQPLHVKTAHNSFDFKELVKDLRRKQMEEDIRKNKKTSLEKLRGSEKPPELEEFLGQGSPFGGGFLDFDQMFKEIDAKIAELEAEEKREREKKERKEEYQEENGQEASSDGSA